MDNDGSSILTLFSVSIDDGAISIDVSWILIAIFIGSGILFWIFNASKTGRFRRKTYELIEISAGSKSNKVKFKPNYADRELAYKIWVELSTRKVGLKIDLENDVIIEVYDSWHSFFKITREMIKDVPVFQVRNVESRKIIDLSIDVLNEGLRPHLTKWQARFRRWYIRQVDMDNHLDFHPQDIQKKFPNYQELTSDMLELNGRLEGYRAKLKEIVFD